MSDICVQVCTHDSPCAANKNVATSLCTYSAWYVRLVWGSEKSIRCRHVMWGGQPFEGWPRHITRMHLIIDWWGPYENSVMAIRVAWGGKSDCLRGDLTLTVCSLFLKELFQSLNFFRRYMNRFHSLNCSSFCSSVLLLIKIDVAALK